MRGARFSPLQGQQGGKRQGGAQGPAAAAAAPTQERRMKRMWRSTARWRRFQKVSICLSARMAAHASATAQGRASSTASTSIPDVKCVPRLAGSICVHAWPTTATSATALLHHASLQSIMRGASEGRWRSAAGNAGLSLPHPAC